MFCIFCGTVSTHGEFCAGCGEKSIATCVKCGTISPYVKKSKYCFNCGELLESKLDKSSKKESFIKSYAEAINKIQKYVRSANKWVSYQELSEYLGANSYLEPINTSDKDSTVGQIIFKAQIRNCGFETIAFKVKNLTDTVRTIRFIKLKTLLINHPSNNEAISVIQKVYADFVDGEVIEISVLG
jgi:hypothetical protein